MDLNVKSRIHNIKENNKNGCFVKNVNDMPQPTKTSFKATIYSSRVLALAVS